MSTSVEGSPGHDGQPGAIRHPDPCGPVVWGTAIETAEEIAEFARWFPPSIFPARQAELRGEAWTTRAPQWVVDRLDRLDPDRRIASITELHDLTR